jgi:uncharacterized protein
VQKIAEQLDDIRLACPVSAVTREADGLRVTHAGGSEHFDQVVMACHSDQALAILGFTASDGQREVLSAIRYQPNRAVLHTDPPAAARSQAVVGVELLRRRGRAGRAAGRRFLPDQQAAAAAL